MTRQEVLEWLEKKLETADGVYEGFFEDMVIAELIEEFKIAFPVRVGTLADSEHGAETCKRCGGENVIWAAPSPLWNYVMRGNDINGESLYGDMVCIRCFIVLAEEKGIHGIPWRVTVDPEPDGLIYETPSGRVWDSENWLWVNPDQVV